MNTYITHGTYGFMRKLKEDHPHEDLVLMLKENDALLYHETIGKTFFKGGTAFDVFHSIGSHEGAKLAAFHHFHIREEGRPIFEDELTRKSSVLQHSGATGSRGLRPFKGNTYLLVTFWNGKRDYIAWEAKNDQYPLSPGHDAVLSKPVYKTEYVIQEEE